jgi:hypothetical protein
LNQHSNHQADNVIALAKKYYAEVEKAKQGLWMLEGSLFFSLLLLSFFSCCT